jgi:hypothetical protein
LAHLAANYGVAATWSRRENKNEEGRETRNYLRSVISRMLAAERLLAL